MDKSFGFFFQKEALPSYPRRRTKIATATPPRIQTLVPTSRTVSASPNSTSAPNAAIIGTVNCTVAACVVDSPGNARYHNAYPIPDVTTPETTANPTPPAETCPPNHGIAKAGKHNTPARTKFPAVSSNGRPLPRPRNVYTPQATPAPIINPLPTKSGARNPGNNK